jgi:predicted P-loop ATPase
LSPDVAGNGILKKTPHNAAMVLTRHTGMSKVFAFDEFHDRVRIVRRPTGRHFTGKHWEGGVLSDAHADDVRMWLSAPRLDGGVAVDFSNDVVDSAIKYAARRNRVHPIRDWLESLPEWDGEVCRTERLFIDYLGCPDTLYHRDAARLWLIAAVARVYEPGHKFDFMPIIEGAQGARKSTFVKTLGGEWFGAPTIDWSNSQKMIEQTEGYWIIEVGELATLNRGEANDVKECIVKTEDRARMAYARNPVSRRRQFVFMGTTNDEQYLRDPTRQPPILADQVDRDTSPADRH